MITPEHQEHITLLNYRSRVGLVVTGGELDVSMDRKDSREVRLTFTDHEGNIVIRYVYMGNDQGFYPHK